MIAGMNTKEKPNVHKYDTYFTAEICLKVWYRQKMGVNEQNHSNFIPQGGVWWWYATLSDSLSQTMCL